MRVDRALLFLLAAQSITAQEERCALELRPGISYATQELGNADIDLGLGSEIIFEVRFMPHTWGYIGWGYNRFNSDETSFAGKGADFEETGYLFGLHFNHPQQVAAKLFKQTSRNGCLCG